MVLQTRGRRPGCESLSSPPKKNIYLKVFPNDTIKRWWSSSCTSFGTRYLFPLIWNFIDINYISLLRHAGLGQEKIKILRFKNDLVSQQIVEEPEEPANFLFFSSFFFTALYLKPSQYIPSSFPVCWLSHRAAVRLDLRLLLSSSAFTLRVLQGRKEGEGEGGVRSKAASSSHLPLSLSFAAEPSTIRRSPSLSASLQTG